MQSVNYVYAYDHCLFFAARVPVALIVCVCFCSSPRYHFAEVALLLSCPSFLPHLYAAHHLCPLSHTPYLSVCVCTCSPGRVRLFGLPKPAKPPPLWDAPSRATVARLSTSPNRSSNTASWDQTAAGERWQRIIACGSCTGYVWHALHCMHTYCIARQQRGSAPLSQPQHQRG